MSIIPDPDRNETAKPFRSPQIPDGDVVDLRQSGLAGFRVLLDEFLSSVDGIGAEEALAVAAHVGEQDEYQGEILNLLTRVVTEDSQRASRAQPRALAIRIIGHLRLEDALPQVTAVLDNIHEPASQRAAAADAVGMIGDVSSKKILHRHLDDPDPTVRRTVALAIGEVAPPKANKWLRRQLDRESDPAVRASLSSALESLNGEKNYESTEARVEDSDTSRFETQPWSKSANNPD